MGDDKKADDSNWGASWVDVAAPGVRIDSVSNTCDYPAISGTSMATPHVSGIAALIKSQFPTLNNWGIRYRIEFTADPIPGTGTLWKYGRVNAWDAVKAPTTTPPIDSTKATFAWNVNPNTNYGNDPNLLVTTWENPPHTGNTYVEHNLSLLPANARITYAGVWMWISSDNQQSWPGWVDIHGVTQPWEEMTLTWNNKPEIRPIRETWQYISQSFTWYWFDLTSLVADWRRPSANFPNYGFIMHGYDGLSQPTFWAWWASDDAFYYAIRMYVQYVIP